MDSRLPDLFLENRGEFLSIQAYLSQIFPKGDIHKVLLVTPPDGDASLFQRDTARRRRYSNYPPYGSAILAAHLRQTGREVRICNLNHEILKACAATDPSEPFDFDAVWQTLLDAEIVDFAPDLIGVTCMFTMTHESLKRVCAHASRHGIAVAIGGVHVSNDINRVLDDIPQATLAFTGEGDLALPRFCDVVSGRRPVEDLKQVTIVQGDRRHSFPQELRPEPEDISIMPAYDLLEVADLSTYGVMGNFYAFKPPGSRLATVLSNRGCRARCTFCSVRNFNGPGVRQRSVESVLDELQLLEETYGIDHIVWLDDDLLKDHERALALFNGKVRRGIKMTWDATNGVIASSCDDETVAAMAESGCIALNIGMESGNPDILRQVKKPGTLKNFLAAAEVFKRYPSIHARVFLMIGFPGETLRMIADTINVARQMDMDWASITPLQPLPNTPIYDAMVAQGLVRIDNASEVRFMSGGFGKQNELETGRRFATVGFAEAFASIPLDAVPTRQQIDDIWFYMNYHLNFHRLFTEDRPVKLRQQMLHLTNLCDVISPEHGLALYFLGYLHHKLDGTIPADIIRRLDGKLSDSPYWRERLDAFGLQVDDLHRGDFRNKEIPRLVPGQLPDGGA